MYDINKLRRKFSNNPKQLELLELIHSQIAKHPASKKLTIIIPKKDYSSKLKKTIIHELGYDFPGKKFYGDDVTIIKI